MRPFFQLILAQAFLLAPCLASPQLPEEYKEIPLFNTTTDVDNNTSVLRVPPEAPSHETQALPPLPYDEGYGLRTAVLAFWKTFPLPMHIGASLGFNHSDYQDHTAAEYMWQVLMISNAVPCFISLVELIAEGCVRNRKIHDVNHRILTTINLLVHVNLLCGTISFRYFTAPNPVLLTQYCLLLTAALGLNVYQFRYGTALASAHEQRRNLNHDHLRRALT